MRICVFDFFHYLFADVRVLYIDNFLFRKTKYMQ
jgi:hypothetical protein